MALSKCSFDVLGGTDEEAGQVAEGIHVPSHDLRCSAVIAGPQLAWWAALNCEKTCFSGYGFASYLRANKSEALRNQSMR
jgi:hypothetical protein